MAIPVQVTFREIRHSDSIEAYVRKRAAKLETFSTRILSCHVVIDSPHRHKQSGRPFRVRINLVVPREDVVVSHTSEDDSSSQDVYASVDEAFDRMGRRLEDYARRLRGDVKVREESYRHGRVKKLWSYEGYGFIESMDGDEVYFHRNSVLHRGFERIKVGSNVRFVEELGDKGPQASTVALSG